MNKNPDIAIDGTDHFALFCRPCNIPMILENVIFADGKNGTFRVSMWAKCSECKARGHRKIYNEYLGDHWKWPSKTDIQNDSDYFNGGKPESEPDVTDHVEDVEDVEAENE